MNDLEPKIRIMPVALILLDAHDLTEHSNKEHNHVDTGKQSL
jgi:hypothetical protein